MARRQARLALSEKFIAAITAVIFVVLGVAMMWAGRTLQAQRGSLVDGGLRAEATLLGFERRPGGSSDGRDETYLTPVVRFRSADGSVRTIQAGLAAPFWLDRRPGDGVVVVYDPRNPVEASVDSFAEIWFAPWLFLVIGFCAALIPPCAIWRHVTHTGSIAGRRPAGEPTLATPEISRRVESR